VINKRRRIYPQTSAEIAEQIQTTNIFESLSEPPCDGSQNGTSTNLKTPNTPKREPKPPPIYIYSVNNLKAMPDNFAMVTENETYIVKALHNDTNQIMPNTPETYRKLIQHVRDENHTSYVPTIRGKSVQNSNPRSASLYTNVRHNRRIKQEKA
jgi:hypothetical protein